MTYAPPYAAPVQMTDPTNVMGRRIGAYFIDVVVPGVIAFIVGFSIWVSSANEITGVPNHYCTDVTHTGYSCVQSGSSAFLATNADTRHAIVVGLLVWLLAPLNAIVLQGITGATVGKYMFGLRVVVADGSIAGFGRVLVRTLLFIVDDMCFALGRSHQRVGDPPAQACGRHGRGHVRRGQTLGGPARGGDAGAGRGLPGDVRAAAEHMGAAPEHGSAATQRVGAAVERRRCHERADRPGRAGS